MALDPPSGTSDGFVPTPPARVPPKRTPPKKKPPPKRSTPPARSAPSNNGGGIAAPRATSIGSGASNSIDKKLLAQKYGWALSVLKSIPELYKIFNQAVKGTWSPDEFAARVRDSKWYKTHNDQFRQTYVLEKTDPSKYKRLSSQKLADIQDLAASMGVKYDKDLFASVTRQALYNGWDDAQVRNALAGMLDFSAGGHFGGEAGQAEQELRNYAGQMGVSLSDNTLKTWLRSLVAGNHSIEDYQAYIQNNAELAFPAFSKQIKSGVTVRQIADPYIQSMGNILEINPNSIDLQNATIRKALTQVDDQGQATGTGVPIWQFENSLRQDPRWLQTNNAREQINGVAHSVLKDFGFTF